MRKLLSHASPLALAAFVSGCALSLHGLAETGADDGSAGSTPPSAGDADASVDDSANLPDPPDGDDVQTADDVQKGDDVPTAVPPTEAGVLSCPAECTGGCDPAGATCTISITTVTSRPVNCPPGIGCRVHCAGTQVCAGVINCAAGQPCTVVCDGDEACSSNNIKRGAASSLCVECLANGNPGCNSAHCVGACDIHCVGGCGDSCTSCTSALSCP